MYPGTKIRHTCTCMSNFSCTCMSNFIGCIHVYHTYHTCMHIHTCMCMYVCCIHCSVMCGRLVVHVLSVSRV